MHSIYPLLMEEGGREFPLSGRIVTIGSSKDCGLRLSGKGARERMGHFLFRSGKYHVQSLSHEDRIRVNGETIEGPIPLSQGDVLEIAASRFRYLESPLEPDDSSLPSPALPDQTPVSEIVDAVVRLLRNRDPDVFASLVAGVSRLLRSDAARVVEENVESGERRTIARYPAQSGLDRFSARAIDWAKSAEKTVLTQEADWEDQNSLSSLRKNAVSSVLCLALRGEDGIMGYLYLDRLRSSAPFTDRDREFCDSLRNLFVEILANRREMARQRETIARLQDKNLPNIGGIIYASKPMSDLMTLAGKVARTGATLLIRGETGTGKELLARFIHENSSRAGKPFIALNCGAIPGNLIESELFGHEKGAFTGADQRKAGLFESASGGTLFLDEIGDLPHDLQVKLLRVLQEGEITRVGSAHVIRVDVRILSATHRDLAKEVQAGRFRQDLFFRLSVLGLELPPLRERGQDISLLADFLLQKYLMQFGFPPKSFSAAARNKLQAYTFPGNIRELENLIQKAILLSETRQIGPEALQWDQAGAMADSPSTSDLPTLKEARIRAEKEAIHAALAKSGGNVSQASKLLDVDRKWLMKLMEEAAIDADDYRK